MTIAFYAPLKSPHHAIPSGDRLMGRQLIQALTIAGYDVTLMSELRSYLSQPDLPMEERSQAAAAEVERIAALWEAATKAGDGGRAALPSAWITYHPYYKSPDLIGPPLCRRFGIPYVTVESSYSRRRNIGNWTEAQEMVADGARLAAANLCLTRRDLEGLAANVPEAKLIQLAPFIDASPFLKREPAPRPGRLVAIGMMRPGYKVSSYRGLAAALKTIEQLDWTLTAIGTGPAQAEVQDILAPFGRRVTMTGQIDQDAVAQILSESAIYTWPGHDEAYGLAYMEAQAAGLPVVAEAVAGVPEAVAEGKSGILTPPGDTRGYAEAIASLLADPAHCAMLGRRARDFVVSERSLTAMAGKLRKIIEDIGIENTRKARP